MVTATERVPECTAEQAAEWQAGFSAGCRAARSDIGCNAGLRMELIDTPADPSYETGAQYVTRHLSNAFALGYAHVWRYHLAGI